MADYVSALNGIQMDAALMDMAEHTSEAYAVGERNGIPVDSDDPTYQNNSKYWADFAADAAEGASIITDPNEDGNLVIEPPTGSESGWAVRYDAAQTLSEAQKAQARANIAASGTNENLLMNAWFTVNQRGAASAANANYGLDRWQGVGTGYTVNNDGSISVTGAAVQKYGDLGISGNPYTISVLYADGTIESGTDFYVGDKVFTFSGGTINVYASSLNQVNIGATTKNVKAIKLEKGNISTLANDAPPDYGAELAKCQRYFYRVSLTTQTDPFAVGIAYSGDLRFLLPIGKMRATPTVAATSVSAIAIRGEGLSGATVTGLTFITQNELGVYLKATTSGSLTSYQLYAMTMTSNSAIIDLSAEP